jgi:hypothetical protein
MIGYGSSNPRPWVTLLLVILVMGIVVGLAVSNWDWVNPKTRSAMAERITIENRRMARQDEIDLRYQEQERQEQLRHLQARNERALQLLTLAGYGLMIAIILVGAGAAVGLTLRLAGQQRSVRDAQKVTQQRRELAIQVARAQEHMERQTRLLEGRLVQTVELRIDQLLERHMQPIYDTGGNGDNDRYAEADYRVPVALPDVRIWGTETQTSSQATS